MSADSARSAAKETAAKVSLSRRTGEAHPILEQKEHQGRDDPGESGVVALARRLAWKRLF